MSCEADGSSARVGAASTPTVVNVQGKPDEFASAARPKIAKRSLWNSAGKEMNYSASMEKQPKYVARIDNIYFINRIGTSLREATSNITMQELPENIRLLLRRLKRMEDRAKFRKSE